MPKCTYLSAFTTGTSGKAFPGSDERTKMVAAHPAAKSHQTRGFQVSGFLMKNGASFLFGTRTGSYLPHPGDGAIAGAAQVRRGRTSQPIGRRTDEGRQEGDVEQAEPSSPQAEQACRGGFTPRPAVVRCAGDTFAKFVPAEPGRETTRRVG